MADSFAFATLFPNVLQVPAVLLSTVLNCVLQPGVAVLSNLVFSLLVRCKVCK